MEDIAGLPHSSQKKGLNGPPVFMERRFKKECLYWTAEKECLSIFRISNWEGYTLTWTTTVFGLESYGWEERVRKNA
jgi:hypothetical protein